MNILISWIGHTDLRTMAPDLDGEDRRRIERVVGPMQYPSDGFGPLKTLLQEESFDAVHLLSNYPKDVSQAYCNWLDKPVTLHPTRLKNVTDHAEIFNAVAPVLDSIKAQIPPSQHPWAYHLSPGTPAMAAVWVLLGKTRYPGTFRQTYNGKATTTDIPFDLTLDVVPELLHGADSALQALAAKPPAEVPGFEDIVGDSRAIRLAVGRARKAAVRDVPVLLFGESGTGKEMFARAIHGASHRREKPFVTVNCAALPGSLLESELFGHEKHAFTGANRDYVGAFERADGGTLFLDEIGECSPDLQSKLLRVLQPPHGAAPCTRVLRRIGSETDTAVDVRVLAATNRDLVSHIDDGAFREDLFYRLAVITLNLPPLRDRRSDISRIADALLSAINANFAIQEPGYVNKNISVNANSFLSSCEWPGNVRQLHNCLAQASVMSNADELTIADFRAALSEMPTPQSRNQNVLERPLGDGFSLENHLDDIHRHYLKRAMTEAHGVKAEAARLLGIEHYQTLAAQLDRLGVDGPEK